MKAAPSYPTAGQTARDRRLLQRYLRLRLYNRGSVTANGGVNAAGIGTGAIDDRDGNYGFVFISGNAEKVEATGGEYGAGIGTGMRSAIEGYDVAKTTLRYIYTAWMSRPRAASTRPV